VLPAARAGRIAYRLLLALALPVAWARLAWRSRTIPALRERWAERRGVLPFAVQPGGLWLHTVSAGETIAAVPLIRALHARHPALPLLVTTMTHTGSERVQALLGDRVRHVYLPWDAPRAVARFLDAVQPRAAVFFETELWPNVLEACHGRGIRTLLLNGRLSARSAAGYARLGKFARRMLGQLDVVACQGEDHAARFASLGVPPARLQVQGNVKFDVAIDEATRTAIARLAAAPLFAGRPVWIAGSTHAGEEAIVLAAHRALRARFPGALLVLVPRHPERVGEVLALCDGLRVLRRSAMTGDEAAADVDVLIGDRMGELLMLYGLAQAAFVGGSLVDVGGHNPIEPAALGVPVLMGPADRNFVEVVAAFRRAGALQVVKDASSLGDAVSRLWTDEAHARALAAAGLAVIAAHRGATARMLALLESSLALPGADAPSPPA
jgi:3-deoxy-D-manno-octulosonic-acid transferase